MAYAIAHPERVSRLILYGTACGEPVAFSGDELAEEETYRSMIRVGWAKEDPAFRRVFTMRFIPGATEEQLRWFDDLQRMSTSATNAVASRIARQQVDIGADLPKISAPTLVLQAMGDRMNTFDNAVSVSSLRFRVKTTSSWPMSRRGACSSTRWPHSSSRNVRRQEVAGPTDRPRRFRHASERSSDSPRTAGRMTRSRMR